MAKRSDELHEVTRLVREFVRARDWEKFHTPKNLVMALAGEVGELSELFQWLTPEESALIMKTPSEATKVRDELADVVVYSLRIADVLGVDLWDAIRSKMQKNAAKYPVSLARGHARKYTELGSAARRRKPRAKAAPRKPKAK